MKKRIFLIAIVTILTGCASSFSDTRNTTPLLYESKLESSLAAKCIRNNADNRGAGGYYSLPIQQGSRPDMLEVRVISPVGVAAIFEIEPAVGGSRVAGWFSNQFTGARGMSMNIYTKGC